MDKSNKKRSFMGIIICMLFFISTVIIAMEVKAADKACTGHIQYITEEMEVDSYRATTDADGNYTSYPVSEKGEDWIFAGWYIDSTCGTALGANITAGRYTAKFVPAHVLDVKAQISANLLNASEEDDSTGSLRFVTSVDSLRYCKVGFEVILGEDEDAVISASDVVYKKLYAVGSGEDVLSYEANDLFCAMSKCFKACTITDIPSSAFNNEISATSFWITKDGTYVRGATKSVSVNDGINACEKYVSVNGSDEDGDGTKEKPYATVNCAITKVIDGGTVMLLSDIIVEEQINITKNVTIKNARGKDVTLTRGASFAGNLFDMNVDNITFTLGTNEENATGTVIVDGASVNVIGGRTVFNHQAESSFVLGRNVTLTNAKASGAGAALANLGTAHLYGNMTNNSSTSNGGAINHASTKKLYIYAGNYTGNTAAGKYGGAIYTSAGGNIIISGGIFSGNSAAKGGAVYCQYFATEGYKLTITGGIFERNMATNNADSGGAIYLQRTQAMITGGTFKENVALYRGGAIQCNADGTNVCELVITGGNFTNNKSNNQGGGGISVLNTKADISGVTMTDNVCLNKDSSTYMGGGALLIQQNSTVTLRRCVINGNTMVGEGDSAADTGVDIGFRGQSGANLILEDETFNGRIACVFGDTAVKVTVGSGNSPVALVKGNIYKVDYTNKTLVSAQ